MSRPNPRMVGMRLPQPNGTFRWTQEGGRTALVCSALEPFGRHQFTTRDWMLGRETSERRVARDHSEGWADVAAAMEIPSPMLVRLRQVHGTGVVACRDGGRRPEEATGDILVSNDPDVAIGIQTADCVPLLMADRRTGVVGAAHVGWRGLAARAPAAAIAALVREFGCKRVDLIVAVGPSIRSCCYEVGDDVRRSFRTAGFLPDQLERWFFSCEQPSVINPSMTGLP